MVPSLLCVTLLKTMHRLKFPSKLAEPCVLDGGVSSVCTYLKLVLQPHQPIEEHSDFSKISRVKHSIETINFSEIQLDLFCQEIADCGKILQGRKWVGDQTLTHWQFYLL